MPTWQQRLSHSSGICIKTIKNKQQEHKKNKTKMSTPTGTSHHCVECNETKPSTDVRWVMWIERSQDTDSRDAEHDPAWAVDIKLCDNCRTTLAEKGY